MKSTGFNSYVYGFSVDYDAIVVDGILDIHKYLMKKMTKCNKKFEFVKKCLFIGLTFLSTLTSVHSLSCISMSNQERKVRLEIVNVNRDDPVFILLALKQANAVVVITILMIHMRKYVFLMLLKT